jgi:hypothetical protein
MKGSLPSLHHLDLILRQPVQGVHQPVDLGIQLLNALLQGKARIFLARLGLLVLFLF